MRVPRLSPVALAVLAVYACANQPRSTSPATAARPIATEAVLVEARSPGPATEPRAAADLAPEAVGVVVPAAPVEGGNPVPVPEPSTAAEAVPAAAGVVVPAPSAVPQAGVPTSAAPQAAVHRSSGPAPTLALDQAPGEVPTQAQLQDQRRVLLDMRSQLFDLTRTLNRMIDALGPVAPLPRERPAMPDCPWPTPVSADTATTEPDRSVPGVVAPPRRRIPDCSPPDWEPPAELAAHVPPELPDDRPRPIVDDYLSYVVTAPPADIVERFDLDTTYYTKYADANGYPILASSRVNDAALAIVRDQVNYMLGHRPEIRETLIAYGGRIVIMAETEYTMDIPEQRDWTVPKYLDPRLTEGERASYFEENGLGSRSAEAYWNVRARGMGGTLTSCAEENVLGYYGTRYWGTNICVHEFSHGIMGAGIGNADPKWFQEIVDSYHAARAACGTDSLPHLRTARGYAGNTFNEYWAVGVEWYVGNGGRDRAELKAEDPTLYELISRLIPEDRHLPVRANVAGRAREDMDRMVQERNPEWWQREQRRLEEQRAARGGGAGRGGRAGGAPAPVQTCTPTVR